MTNGIYRYYMNANAVRLHTSMIINLPKIDPSS